MALQYKQTFRRLNLVTDPFSLRRDEYTYLRNGVMGESPDGDGLAIKSVLGNSELTNADLPAGTNTIVGRWRDKINNRVFFLVHNSTAANHTLYRLNSDGTFTRVMRSAVLDLALGRKYEMVGIDDLIFWTDGVTETKKIDTAKAIAGGVYTPLAEEITLIKPAPALPLTWTLGYDNNTESNFMFGNYFQFFYRYIYENYDYSVFSPASKTTNSWALPPDTAVKLATTGNIALTGVVLVDGVNTTTGDRILVGAQTDPIQNGIYVAAAGAWTRAADFPAGTSSDRTVYVEGGLIYNYRSVFRINSINPGTVATYARKLEGPNYATISRPVTPPSTVIGIEYAVRINGANEVIVYRREQSTAFSASHTFYNNAYLFTVPDSDAFRWHDVVPLTSKSLDLFKNRIFLLHNTEGFTHTTTQQVGLSLSQVTLGATKVMNTAKPGSRVSVGIVFKGYGGRDSGVQCVNSINITDNAQIFYKIMVATAGIAASIPAWATHFSIVATKPLTESYFVCARTQDIFHYKKDASGVFSYNKTLTGFAAEGTAIDIGSLTKVRRGYTFSQGDRIKIYDVKFFDGTTETSAVINLEILGQQGRFVLTRVITEIALSTTGSDVKLFEIYSPKKTTNEPYFEIGQTYAIGLFSVGPFTLEGDIEVTTEAYYAATGTYSATNPFTNSYDHGVQTLLVRKMNAWDQNSHLWVTQTSGRSHVPTDSRQLVKDNYVRFGQQYVEHASVFGLNTFLSVDEYTLKFNNGPGIKLQSANNVLVAVCQNETVALYIGDSFVKTSDSNQFLAKTDNVIGDDREYFGGFGSLHPESVAADESGRFYFYDMTKGVIVRRSNDGLTPISDLYGIGAWIREFSRVNFANASSMRFPGGYCPVYKMYHLSAINTAGTVLWTIGFHEADEFSQSPYWVGFFDYLPLFYSELGGYMLTFREGRVWRHNNPVLMNLYGVQRTRELEFTIPLMGSKVNLLEGVSIDAEDFWNDSGANDEVVKITDNGTGVIRSGPGTRLTRINYLDMKKNQGVWQSAIFRDINTPQPFAAGKAKYEGEKMRGQVFKFTIYANKTNDEARLRSVTVLYTPSPRSYV